MHILAVKTKIIILNQNNLSKMQFQNFVKDVKLEIKQFADSSYRQ